MSEDLIWNLFSSVIAAGSGIGGAVLGARLAARDSANSQREATRRAIFREEEAERARLDAESYKLALKLSSIYSSVATLRRSTDMSALNCYVARLELFQGVLPVIALPDDVKISEEELVVAGRTGGGSLIDTIVVLAERRNSLFAALRRYDQVRSALQDEYPEVIYQGLAATALPDDVKRRIGPRVVSLNRLAASFIDETAQLHRSTFRAVELYRDKFRERFGRSPIGAILYPPEA